MTTAVQSGKQAILWSPYDSQGIEIRYVKSRRMLEVSGWYDHVAGIEGGPIDLADFFDMLEISERNTLAAFRVLRERKSDMGRM